MKKITIEELRAMRGREGLILQGCGGDLSDWEDGITDELVERGIIIEGACFDDARFFDIDGLTCILLPFEGIEIDMGKLALWRLETQPVYGSTWQSDYMMNKFGIDTSRPMQETGKPDCPLIGADGNIFNLIGLASKALISHGLTGQAAEMKERVFESGSYEAALAVISGYVNITSEDEMEPEDEDEEYGPPEMGPCQ